MARATCREGLAAWRQGPALLSEASRIRRDVGLVRPAGDMARHGAIACLCRLQPWWETGSGGCRHGAPHRSRRSRIAHGHVIGASVLAGRIGHMARIFAASSKRLLQRGAERRMVPWLAVAAKRGHGARPS